MLFKWVDYCEKYEEELAAWTDDGDTNRFALFDDTIKETHEYYTGVSKDYDGHDYKLNRTYFCKVVLDGDITAAVLFLFRSDTRNVVHINPIIVNPEHRNKGYCTKIISELVNNVSEIIGYESIAVTADFSTANKASIRVFEKVGFVMAGRHADGNFTYWTYPACELENYQKYCKDSMGDEFIFI